MFLLQANSQADPTIGIAYIIGFLIPLVIVSVLSAWFIKLGYKLLTKKSVSFAKPFWISFFSIAAAFIVQAIIKNTSSNSNAQSSIIAVLPALVFFLICWLLNSQLIKYSDSEDSKNYGLAFGVTVIQSACLIDLLQKCLIDDLSSSNIKNYDELRENKEFKTRTFQTTLRSQTRNI